MFQEKAKDQIIKKLSIFKKIKDILAWITLLVFMGYYIYKIVDNINHRPYLSIYSILLFVTIITTILGQKKAKTNKDKMSKSAYKIFILVIKHLAKLSLIIVTIVEFVQYGYRILDIILVIWSLIMLILTITMDIVYNVLYRYYLKISQRIKDKINSGNSLNEVKGKIFSYSINSSLEDLNNNNQ